MAKFQKKTETDSVELNNPHDKLIFLFTHLVYICQQ